MPLNLNEFEKRLLTKDQREYTYSPNFGPSGEFNKEYGITRDIRKIKNILMCPIRSYPFDPNYGSNLHKMLFEPADDFTAKKIYEEVVERIEENSPSIEISDIRTVFFSDRKGFRISLTLAKDDTTEAVQIDILDYGGSTYLNHN